MNQTVIKTNIVLDGYWGDESVLVSKNCMLYELREKIINKLTEEKIILDSDMDSRNKTAHIRLTTKKNPKDERKYNMWNNKQLSITFDDIKINDDYIEFKLPQNKHMTIIYKKNINKDKDKIIQLTTPIFNDFYLKSMNQVEHMKDKKINKKKPINIKILELILKLDSYLGDDNILISSGCSLYKLKEIIIQKLIDAKIISIDDINDKNRIMCIKINPLDKSMDENKRKECKDILFKELNLKKIYLQFKDIRVNKNSIKIILPERRNIIILCKNGVGDTPEKINSILTLISSSFDEFYLESVKQLINSSNEKEESKDDSDTFLCKICFESNFNIRFDPCGHTCSCESCSNALIKCPICNTIITLKQKTYIS
jgi:hypothetical protein